ASAPADAPNPRKVADAVPADWQVVRVDLWEALKKPVRIRAMRLASAGGSAGFDQIVLGRTEKDLPAAKKELEPKDGVPKGEQKPAAPPDVKEIERLLQQLGSPMFTEREAAAKALAAAGEPALEPLRRAAATSPDAEIRRRAEDLVRAIEKRFYGELRCLQGHPNAGQGVAFSPGGRHRLSRRGDPE